MEPEPPDKRPLPWALILGLTVLAYIPVLRGTFNFDDVATILRDPSTTRWRYVWLSLKTFPGGRPVFWATLAADHALWGLNPAGYHLTNLLLHVFNTALLALLAARLGNRALGTAAGLLFGLHPLASSAACYVSERSNLLVAASALGVLHALMGSRWRWAAAFWVLGCLSKESGVVIPFCALPLLRLLPGEEERKAARTWLFTACALAATTGLWILALDHGPRADHPSWSIYALTELRVVWRYLALWILPLHQCLDPDAAFSSGWLSPASTLTGALALAGLGLLLFLRRGRWPWAFAGVAAAMMALLPDSSIVPLVDPMAEYRMYLPCAFLALAAAPALLRLWTRSRPAAWGLTVLALALTASHAGVWATEAGPWQENLRIAPRKLRVHANLSLRYRALALFDPAERLILRAVRIRERPEQWRDLAKIAYLRGDPLKERTALTKAVSGFLKAGRTREAAELRDELERLPVVYSRP